MLLITSIVDEPFAFALGTCARLALSGNGLDQHGHDGLLDAPSHQLLMKELQREFQLTYLFISHCLPVVAQVATHIGVTRAGPLIQYGPANRTLYEPTQAYTRDLVAAMPEIPRLGQV
jgi:ABC-type phosphonate transport system ATPase subunit